MSKVIFTEVGTTPPPPSSGQVSMYVKTDEVLYIQDSAGIETPLGSSAAITQLTGDVTGIGPGPTVTTVQFVGGSSAANVHSAELLANASTSANTPSTIVRRDASGNFAAGTITASLNGNATTSTTSTNFSGTLSGDVTGTQSATVVALVGGSTAANVHSAELAANAATASNTATTIVKRDASGNFAAGTITANLTGTATNATNAVTAVNFSGVLSGDVTGTQSATAISNTTVTGKLLTGYTVGGNTPISSTDSILLAFEKTQGQINATTGAAITSLTGDVVATGPGTASSTIQPNVVTNAKLAQAPANTLKGNNTAGTANETDLTVAQVNTMLGTVINVTGSGNIASSGGPTPNITFTGTLPITNGGTNSNTALNNNRIMVSSGGAIIEAPALTNGQLNIGSTGAAPVQAALTAGSGITITNGAGSITIATTGLAATTTKTANYTILTTDSTIFCDTSAGAFTLTLPSPTGIAGKLFRIIDTTGTFQTNNLTLARSSTEKIEGLAASKVLQTSWGFFTVITNGVDWFLG